MKAKIGRPPGSGIEIPLEEVKRWARAGCTWDEMAQRLGVSRPTFSRRMEDPEFHAEYEKGRAEMIIGLRSKQVAMAMAGDRTMLIWLGKQYLGQKDKQEHSGTGPGGAIVIQDDATAELKARVDALHERLSVGADSVAPRTVTH